MSQTQGLCRDCLSPQIFATDRSVRRCQACGSPRALVHPELDELTIAHVDCDAFYATVEKRDNPSLRDKPLIVGGGKRGVVATCCYIARTYGVHSAMPMFKALAACPQAVVVPPDMAKYARVARQVRALMLELTPQVEPISIDEAFLDLSGTQALHGGSAAFVLSRFATRIEKELGITVSIGLSYCKFLAKIASDLDKPRGFQLVGREEAIAFLRGRPIGLISGVGKVMQERLAREGFVRFGDLQSQKEEDLLRRYGPEGQRLHRLAQGIDRRKVTPERDTKSISAETTFDTDISRAEDLLPVLHRLSEKVAVRLRRSALATRGLSLKLKSADFKTRTRARSGFAATQLSNRLFTAARDLLLRELDGTRFRLIGIAAHDLCPAEEADQGDLVDTGLAREKATEAAIDALRDKFGPGAVVKGISLRPRTRR
ncbi:DNA polymerase IV [Methyloferula stellata]|uniref:DNA polymerase IV n=1 Tax=Methyloferula stellata TaxID=876270 RepID=UPI00037078C4|nr:DNA polymerase IV [Methyloferula stellata]